ncbi:COPII coat Sec23p-Sfb3p heterodimer component [Linnemannia zychae]|nr:COPII coat Sec23p-Sfb3p heterodimer component [Linnemannia zychae]
MPDLQTDVSHLLVLYCPEDVKVVGQPIARIPVLLIPHLQRLRNLIRLELSEIPYGCKIEPVLEFIRVHDAFHGTLKEIKIKGGEDQNHHLEPTHKQLAMRTPEVVDARHWKEAILVLDAIPVDCLRTLILGLADMPPNYISASEYLQRCIYMEELRMPVRDDKLFAWAVKGRKKQKQKPPHQLPHMRSLELFGDDQVLMPAVRDAVDAFRDSLESLKVMSMATISKESIYYSLPIDWSWQLSKLSVLDLEGEAALAFEFSALAHCPALITLRLSLPPYFYSSSEDDQILDELKVKMPQICLATRLLDLELLGKWPISDGCATAMSNYQSQQQQPRPYYPGQGQPPPPQHPGQQNTYGTPANSQQQYQQQQQPLKPPGGPYGNIRPSGPVPGNQSVRPGPGQMAPGIRPIAPVPAAPMRPPVGAPSHQHQQQHHQPQHPYTGGRPAGPPIARPAGGVRPMNQQIRADVPMQAGMATAAPHHSNPAHTQTPTPITTPATQSQSPPRPQTTTFPHNAGPPSGQQQPYQQQQQQQPTPPLINQQATAGLNGLNTQMSAMSVSTNNASDPSGYNQIPPQGPPMQSEATKPKTGARAKRVYVTDPSAPPPSSGMAPHPPAIPQPGMEAQNFGQQRNQHPNQQQPGWSQQPQQQANAPYQQQQQQQQPATYMAQQQPNMAQQPHLGPQPMNQSQQFRPQAQVQPASRPRIDPDQIPSPVAVQEADQEEWDQKPFVTSSRTSPTPLASSDFTAIDGGNCNPRFFRMTTYNLPNTEDLLNTSQLPMGLVIQPLAQLHADEAPIETVDFGDSGPARCRRCNAYINPYMIFTSGGQRFVCNMCLFENEVDPSYFCNLDMNGRRCDLDQRPELRNGTIEFAVPKEYWSKTPAPAAYVFAIDVSWNSVQSGMLQRCVAGIKEAIWDANGISKLAPGTRIGFLTFDKNVHFYNLSPTLEQAQMMVVPDVSDVFVPLSDGFLVDPQTSQPLVESMLDMLSQLFAENKTTEAVIGAVVQAVRMALESRGGKLIIFQTSLPTFGPGALRHRDDMKLYGTEKEKTLYAPQDDFYKKLAESCVDAGLSIDLFLFPNAYVDVATLGCLSTITGGETFMFTNFNSERDGVKLLGEINKLVTRPFGFNALMRVRCSTGLRIAEHFGNFHMKNSTDLEIAGLDSEKAYGVLVKHDGRLDEKTEASFQVALLYTTADGHRRVRVHNFSTPVTTLLGNVFRWADMDTTINFLSKGAIAQALSKPLNEVREALTDKCVKILSAYRRNCASSTAPGQLILPESFKLFPLYTLCLLKSKILRVGRDINSDQRVYQMRMVKSMGVSESIVFFYPRMMTVHTMDERVGVMDINGRVFLPQLVRASYARLNSGGAYLLENGQRLFFWLGREIHQQFLQDVFGVQSLDEVDPSLRFLPEIDTHTSSQLRMIRTYIQSQRARYLDLTIVRQGKDQAELDFSNLLVEDKNNEAMSYVDYLPTIHRMIQTEVTTRPHEVHTGIWSHR